MIEFCQLMASVHIEKQKTKLILYINLCVVTINIVNISGCRCRKIRPEKNIWIYSRQRVTKSVTLYRENNQDNIPVMRIDWIYFAAQTKNSAPQGGFNGLWSLNSTKGVSSLAFSSESIFDYYYYAAEQKNIIIYYYAIYNTRRLRTLRISFLVNDLNLSIVIS